MSDQPVWPLPEESVPLLAGRELRIRQEEGAAVTVSLWRAAENGKACLGEALVDAEALRRVIGALREALWRVERAEGAG